MRGLDPRIHLPSEECAGNVFPIRVLGLDQVDFPRTGPMFDGFLPLDGLGNEIKLFGVDQTGEAVAVGEIAADAGAVLPRASDKVGRDTDVERASWFVGHNVDPARSHEHLQKDGYADQVRA